MPFIKHSSSNLKHRILISGFSKSGKTTSLPTFIYGPYDYKTEPEKAYEFAQDKRMVILTCPGETGLHSLPDENLAPHITSYSLEVEHESDMRNVKWSIEALKDFDLILEETLSTKPDFLVLDGIQNLHEQLTNRVTSGAYLNGQEFSTFLFDKAHSAFGQYFGKLYNCSVPIVIYTVLEEWEAFKEDTPHKPGSLEATLSAPKFLWPALPGKMAKKIVSKCDMRLSAQLGKICIHKNCEESKRQEIHHVWQIYPKGDVIGVGINGLNVNKAVKDCPFIHQNYHSLQRIIEACS